MWQFGYNSNQPYSKTLASEVCDIVSLEYFPSLKLMQLQPKPGHLGYFHQVEKLFLRLETAT